MHMHPHLASNRSLTGSLRWGDRSPCLPGTAPHLALMTACTQVQCMECSDHDCTVRRDVGCWACNYITPTCASRRKICQVVGTKVPIKKTGAILKGAITLTY
eukprot:1159852-Pelagomonas_calceolata.AAC.2